MRSQSTSNYTQQLQVGRYQELLSLGSSVTPTLPMGETPCKGAMVDKFHQFHANWTLQAHGCREAMIMQPQKLTSAIHKLTGLNRHPSKIFPLTKSHLALVGGDQILDYPTDILSRQIHNLVLKPIPTL